MLSLLIVAGFAAAAYHFLLGPQINAHREQTARLAEARAEFARLNALVQALKPEEGAREQARVSFEQLSARFPAGVQDGLFLAQIGRLAEECHVGLRKLKPAPPADLGCVCVLPVEVELRGSYPSLLQVIDRLANADTFMEIRNLHLRAAQKPPGENGRQQNSGGGSGKSTGSTGEQEQGYLFGSGSPDGMGTASFVYAPAPPEEITAGMLLLIYFRPPAGESSPEEFSLEEIKSRAAARPDPFRSLADNRPRKKNNE